MDGPIVPAETDSFPIGRGERVDEGIRSNVDAFLVEYERLRTMDTHVDTGLKKAPANEDLRKVSEQIKTLGYISGN